MKRKQKKKNRKSITCAFCQGKGLDPFAVPSAISKCQVCKGRGKNIILEPVEKCFACLGTGIYKHHRLCCAVCQGKGYTHNIADLKHAGWRREQRVLESESVLPSINTYDL
jgi:DnaJ-class molecular chaperone